MPVELEIRIILFTVLRLILDVNNVLVDTLNIDALLAVILFTDVFNADKLDMNTLKADKFTEDKFTFLIFVKSTLVPDKFPIEQFDIKTKFELLPI